MIDRDASSCSEAEPFALQVLGDSMEPEFKDGVIIIIDPEGVAADGCYVLAEDGQGEYIFRQLRIDEAGMRLVALKAGYPEQPLARGLESVKGVVIQQAGRRRKDRKFYDRERQTQ